MAQPIVGRLDANAAVARFAPAPGGNVPAAPARILPLPLRARQAPPPAPGRLLPLPLRARQAPPPAPPGPPPILPPVVLPPAPNRVLNAAGAQHRAAGRQPGGDLVRLAPQHAAVAPQIGHAAAGVQLAQVPVGHLAVPGGQPADPVGGHLVLAGVHPADPVAQQPAAVPGLPAAGGAAALAADLGVAAQGVQQQQQVLIGQPVHPEAVHHDPGNVAAASNCQPVFPVALSSLPSSHPASATNKRQRTTNAMQPERIRSVVDDLRLQGLNDDLADSLIAAMQGDAVVGPGSITHTAPTSASSLRSLPLHRSSVPTILKRLNFDASAMGAFLEPSDSKQPDATAFLAGKIFTFEKCEAFLEGHDPSEEFAITKFPDIVSVVARRGIHTSCSPFMSGNHPWSDLSFNGKLLVCCIKSLQSLEIIVALCEDPDADPVSIKKGVASMWACGFDLLGSPGEKAKAILQRQQQLAERMAKLAARSASSVPSVSSTPTVSTSSPSAPPVSRRGFPRRNTEYCFKWNNNYRSCPDPCPHRRLHLCWGCRSPHPLSHCPTKDLAPPMAKPGASQAPPAAPVQQLPSSSPFHLSAAQLYGSGQSPSALGAGGQFGGYGQSNHNFAAPPPTHTNVNALPTPPVGRPSPVGYSNHPVTGQPVFNPSWAGYGPPPGQNTKKNGLSKGKQSVSNHDSGGL